MHAAQCGVYPPIRDTFNNGGFGDAEVDNEVGVELRVEGGGLFDRSEEVVEEEGLAGFEGLDGVFHTKPSVPPYESGYHSRGLG